MDYLELSGATISERDKAFAQEFANFVNGSMSSSSWHSTISREDTMTAMSGHHGFQQKPTNGSSSVT